MIPQNCKTIQKKKFKIGEFWNFLLAFNFWTFSPNAQIWAIWTKKYWHSNLNKISLECVNLIFFISFSNFWAHIPKFGHFGPKNINFLTLTKFAETLFQRCCFQIWHEFLKMLIPNAQIWTVWSENFDLIANLIKILSAPYFEDAHFKSDIGFWKFWNFITFFDEDQLSPILVLVKHKIDRL